MLLFILCVNKANNIVILQIDDIYSETVAFRNKHLYALCIKYRAKYVVFFVYDVS